MQNVNLLLSDARGIYIPRDFVQDFDLSKWEGIEQSDVDDCWNPEEEWYWESWHRILANARYTHTDGRVFTLHQDGDLWAICYDAMTDEEKENFGFDE